MTDGADTRSRWEDPAFSLSVSDGSVSSLVLGGWHLEAARWEHHLDGLPAPELDTGSGGMRFGPEVPLAEVQSFELEVVADEASGDLGRRLTDGLLGATMSRAIWSTLATLGKEPISSNRDLVLPPELTSAGVRAVDLFLCTLPSRRGDAQAPLLEGGRWARVFDVPNGLVTLYLGHVVGQWKLPLRPHHGVPGRSREWFSSRTSGAGPDPARRLAELVGDMLTHQRYFLRSWTTEMELWESQAIGLLTSHDLQQNLARTAAIEADFAALAGYLTQVRVSNRNLERRCDVSALVRSHQDVQATMRAVADEINTTLDQHRRTLRQGMALLNTATATVQRELSEEQRAASERLQTLVIVVTTVFLVPSLVIGVYGANLHELSDGARGSVASLAVWVMSTLAASWSALSLIQRRPTVPGRWSGTVLAAILLGALLAVGVVLAGSSSSDLAAAITGWAAFASMATISRSLYPRERTS